MSNDEDNPINEATITDMSTNSHRAEIIDSPVTYTLRPSTLSNENVNPNEPFAGGRPLSPRSLTRILGISCRKRSNDMTVHSEPSNLPGPSSSSNFSGASTSFSGFGSVDSTNDTDEGQTSFTMIDELTAETLRPVDTRRNTMNSTNTANAMRILNDESLGMGNDNNEMSTPINDEILLPDLDTSSHNNYTAADLSVASDQLFAPEESSSYFLPESILDMQLSRSPYLNFLDRQNSADEHSSWRPSRLIRRYLRSPSSQTDPFRERESEISARFGNSQRLTYLRSRLLNPSCRLRYLRRDLLSRHKTTAALNTVASNGDGENSANNLHELTPNRRNLWLPDFHTESSRSRSRLDPIERNTNTGQYQTLQLRRIASTTSPSIIDFEPALRIRALRRPSTSNIRARSVSPTSASPNISASVHDEPLDDIGINLRSDNSRITGHPFSDLNSEDEIPRPDSPLPPILSPTDPDEDMELISPILSGNQQSEISTSLNAAQSIAMACQPMNLSMSVTEKRNVVKEAPRTYEDLNSELIQLLECPICFEFTTPPINQCLQGHIICNNCRQRVTTCPTCRTIFQESRNLIMEKVAALLRYPCKNAVTGCMEFLYLLQKEQHEMSCGFRQYSCFLCNWRGYKPELLVHVQETHEYHVIHGPSTNLLIPACGQTKKVWLMSAFNELFYVIFFTTLGILKGCVRFIGDCSKCDNYIYNISVTSAEDMLRNFNFSRTTHAYEENLESTEMIDSYDLFSISHAQLNLFRKGTKAPVRITIEEAQKRTESTAPTSSNAN